MLRSKGRSIYSRDFLNYKTNEVLMILRITSAHWEFQKNFFLFYGIDPEVAQFDQFVMTISITKHEYLMKGKTGTSNFT